MGCEDLTIVLYEPGRLAQEAMDRPINHLTWG